MNPLRRQYPLKTIIDVKWLLVLLVTVLSGPLMKTTRAQGADSLVNTIMTYNLYSALGDHRETFYHRWLKADGTFLDLVRESRRISSSPSPDAPETGTWRYIQDTSTTGRIDFSTTLSNLERHTYLLEFSSSKTGAITLMVDGSLAGASGTGNFNLRSAQIAAGPTNLSTRTFLSPNGATIAGFILSGSERRFVLLRAVGPGLAPFAVTNLASKMELTVFNAATVIGRGVEWSKDAATMATYQNLFNLAGAFPLTPGGGDSCLMIELDPGNYTVQMSSAAAGNAIVEAYFLP